MLSKGLMLTGLDSSFKCRAEVQVGSSEAWGRYSWAPGQQTKDIQRLMGLWPYYRCVQQEYMGSIEIRTRRRDLSPQEIIQMRAWGRSHV